MSKDSFEERLKRLEQLEEKVEKIWKNLPKCPECGFILMADETSGHHFQCYSCGCWWDIPKPLSSFVEETGHKGRLPSRIIPNRRRLI